MVLEDAGAGNGPEHAVASLGGSVDREIPLVSGFTARVPRSALETLRGTPGVRSVNADRRFKLRSTEDAPVTPATTLGAVNGAIRADRSAPAGPTSRSSTPASRPSARSPAAS